jgi:hypothetical protein
MQHIPKQGQLFFFEKLATVGAEILCKSMLETCDPLSIPSFMLRDEQLTSEGLYSVREKACDWPSHSSSNSIFRQKFISENKNKNKLLPRRYLALNVAMYCGLALKN